MALRDWLLVDGLGYDRLRSVSTDLIGRGGLVQGTGIVRPYAVRKGEITASRSDFARSFGVRVSLSSTLPHFTRKAIEPSFFSSGVGGTTTSTLTGARVRGSTAAAGAAGLTFSPFTSTLVMSFACDTGLARI